MQKTQQKIKQGVPKVVIIGGGVIGSAIAYELSQVPDLEITVLEAHPQTGQGSSSSALGVLMAASSRSKKSSLIDLRLASLRRFESLIPELAAKTGRVIPYNRHGILCLYEYELAEEKWQPLIVERQAKGFDLQWLYPEAIRSRYPQFVGGLSGLFSADDRAVSTDILIQALVQASEINGVKFICDRTVNISVNISDLGSIDSIGDRLLKITEADYVVIAAGLGSNRLLAELFPDPSPELLSPVGGQAIKVHVPGLDLPTIIHSEDNDGNDINVVPLGENDYWIGATIEFDVSAEPLPRAANIPLILAQVSKFCPSFNQAQVLATWAGDRPRPNHQGAPILGWLGDRQNILIATGHYRNGVLMAPVTAQIIRDLIVNGHSAQPWQGQQIKLPKL